MLPAAAGSDHGSALRALTSGWDPGTEACALLPAAYPVLVNGTANQTFPVTYFPTDGGIVPNGTGGGLVLPYPPGVNTTEPPNFTVGEVRADWGAICTSPEFVWLASHLDLNSDFQLGASADFRTGNLSLGTGFAWSAACPTAPFPDDAYENYSSYVNWSAPPTTGGGCTYEVSWSSNFLANGTTNVVGPYHYAATSIWSPPAAIGPGPPPGAFAGLPLIGLLLAAAATLAVIGTYLYLARR